MVKQLSAIVLDDFLANITPAERKLLRNYHDNTGLIDQVRAAAADSQALHRAATGGTPIRAVHTAAIPDWMRLSLLDAFLQWITGEARICTHMPDPRRPEPVYAAAWTPNTITCLRCIRLLGVHGIKDRTCDCCGRITSGDEDTDPIFAMTVWFGSLCYYAGACTDCAPDDLIQIEGTRL